MSYVLTTEQYGRREYRLDLPAFTRDLANAVGGDVREDPEDHWTRHQFHLPGKLLVMVTEERGANFGKVHLSIYPEDVPHNLHGAFSYDREGKYRLPRITVTADRPMESLARDVKRRLIEAAATPVANRRAVATERQEWKTSLAASVEALKTRFPAIRVQVSDSGTEAAFDGQVKNNYLSGRVYSNGTVTIDRMGSIPLDTFAKIYETLGGE